MGRGEGAIGKQEFGFEDEDLCTRSRGRKERLARHSGYRCEDDGT